ncbi:MAG: type II toxin-antitoxin system VapC family toxin [Desulfobacteraceae bacterium]|nr:PIN domain-containing protein [Desulfobacteraceae bacterium]MBC2757968.1 type II toxin-antitoxin system VapC family toxin [Desulfobacteraceae bacterium]
MKKHKKTYLIDTNVILRFLLDDHEKFSPKAIKFMQQIEKRMKRAEIIAPVIVECVYVLEKFYKIPRSEIADKLCGILTFSGIANHDKNELIIALIEYGNSKIDIVDCMLAAFTTNDKMVISFDKDFRKLNCQYDQL